MKSNLFRGVANKIRVLHPAILAATFSFVAVKILLLWGGYPNLIIQGPEDMGRAWMSYNYSWLHPFQHWCIWLPLHSFFQSLSPHSNYLLFASIQQTLISIAGGIVAGAIAYHLAKHWLAYLAALVAWLASTQLSLMGIGHMSEPLSQLELLLAAYFLLLLLQGWEKRWLRVAFLCSLLALELTRYEGPLLAVAFWAFWSVALFKTSKGTLGCKLRHMAIMAALLAAVPLTWCLCCKMVTGEWLWFAKVHADYPRDMGLYPINPLIVGSISFYLTNILLNQPVIFVATIVMCLVLRQKIRCGFLLAPLAAVIAVFWGLTMRGHPAYSTPIRFASNAYVLVCPLFGYCAYLFLKKFWTRQYVLYLATALLLVPPFVVGMKGFLSQEPYPTDIAVAIDLRATISRTNQSEPVTVALDVSRRNWEVTHFFYYDIDVATPVVKPIFFSSDREPIPARSVFVVTNNHHLIQTMRQSWKPISMGNDYWAFQRPRVSSTIASAGLRQP